MDEIKDFIDSNPWLSLTGANLLVAVLATLATGAVNVFTIAFLFFAGFSFLLNVVTESKVVPRYVIPGTNRLHELKINKKEVKEFSNSHISAAGKYADENRDGVFLGNAKNVYTPAQLEEMAKSDDNRIKAFVALNPLTPVTVLESLSHSNDKGVLNAVASNRRTPSAVKTRVIYTKLIDLTSEGAQVELLDDPETPAYVLQNIYQKPYNQKEVYKALVNHPNTPKALFDTLTEGNDLDILVAIGSSPTFVGNKALIAKLRRFTDYDIMEAVLTNPAIDTQTLDMFNPVEEYLRGNMNVVIRNTELKLPPVVMAWVARKAPSFRSLMINRLKEENPSLANFPTDAILKLY